MQNCLSGTSEKVIARLSYKAEKGGSHTILSEEGRIRQGRPSKGPVGKLTSGERITCKKRVLVGGKT